MDLGIEHLAGKAIDKAYNYLVRAKLAGRTDKGVELGVEEHVKRLGLVASISAGREVRVKTFRGGPGAAPYKAILGRMGKVSPLAEHAFGFSDGDTFYLPEKVDVMDSLDAQFDALRLLVFFLSFQIKYETLEFAASRKAELASCRVLSDAFWILENKRLGSLMLREFPGLLRPWTKVSAALMGKRPAAGILNAAETKMEALLRDAVAGVGQGPGVLSSPAQSFSEAGKVAVDILGVKGRKPRYGAVMPFFVWGRLVLELLEAGTTVLAGSERGEKNDNKDSRGPGKEGERSGYFAKRENINERENEAGWMLNIYDKMLSWARFVNVRRPFDDDEDKDNRDKADSMEEISIAEVERGTSNYFDAELEKGKTIVSIEAGQETPNGCFAYDEWDYERVSYKKEYAKLKEETVEGNHDKGFGDRTLELRASLIKEARRRFEAITPVRRFTGRQFDGEDIDLNAVVEAFTDISAGLQPDDRLYMTNPRTEKDLSVLFLVDLSMSTDAWLKSARVIDHEKEALIVLCEALAGHRERYAICGFSGKTRENVRYFRIKGFDEAYGREVRGRIGGLIPYHYTRMGPAIRHSAALLGKEKSSLKLLFVISDGKPNDVDEYEGKYGAEDTRMALREAEKDGIAPFCLTLDAGAPAYLTRLFGRGNYAVVPGVDRLSTALPELYVRIARNL
ncbi:MAG: hypothetical protein OEV59_02325 [Deltaproteobacteria bacterium]|nr:hypothetical protein [Deltaproteobacteria bacterium]